MLLESQRRPGPVRWWLLAPPLLASAVALAAMGVASGGFSAGGGVDLALVAFVAWNISPGLGLAAVAVVALRGRRRLTALLVGGLVLLAVTVAATTAILRDPSSTAGLGFIFVPVLTWTVVLVAGLVTLLGSGRES